MEWLLTRIPVVKDSGRRIVTRCAGGGSLNHVIRGAGVATERACIRQAEIGCRIEGFVR